MLTAAVREWASNLPRMLATWRIAVRGLMYNRSAISRSGRPSTKRCSTSSSRSVSPEVSASAAGGAAGKSCAAARTWLISASASAGDIAAPAAQAVAKRIGAELFPDRRDSLLEPGSLRQGGPRTEGFVVGLCGAEQPRGDLELTYDSRQGGDAAQVSPGGVDAAPVPCVPEDAGVLQPANDLAVAGGGQRQIPRVDGDECQAIGAQEDACVAAQFAGEHHTLLAIGRRAGEVSLSEGNHPQVQQRERLAATIASPGGCGRRVGKQFESAVVVPLVFGNDPEHVLRRTGTTKITDLLV